MRWFFTKNDDEENLALASKARKGKGKASHFKLNSSHGGKKGDMSKVICFNCHKMGHYATKCPLKKSKKGSSEGSEGEALASQLEMDFTLIACMVSSMMGCVWYLDSGASFHMTSDKNLFSALEEKDLKMHIEMGDNRRLKKNLVSVVMLEDKGYDVVFSKGKAFLRHIATGQTKRIGIWVKNLYKLGVDDYATLSTKVELVQSQDIGELWHRQLHHLNHGDLKIMQQISTRLPKGKLEHADTLKRLYLGKVHQVFLHDRDSQAEAILEQKKDQTFTKFCEFKALVEKELGKNIKALRRDNNGEYVSQEFKNFCAVEGIK
eukprot:PITA_12445